MVDVYISPSNQAGNLYAVGGTTEKEQCNRIADYLVNAFLRCEVSYLRADSDSKLVDRCKQANKEGHTIYLSIHTNASGEKPNTTVRGTNVGYYKPKTGKSYSACATVLNELVAIGLKDRGLTDRSTWYEPKNSTGATVYCEVEFHDHADGAKWIIDNKQKIAEAMCKGLCTDLGKSYVEPVAEKQPVSTSITMTALAEKLKADGIINITL